MEQCGQLHPRVAYLGSASGDDPDFFQVISALFKRAGASEVRLASTAGARVDMVKTFATLERVDVILVSGGDVDQGMRLLEERHLVSWLRARYDRGTAFIGLSAGSIMLCRQWVRWRDPDDDSSIEAFDCLGLAPILCDTHGEDDEWEELHALLRLASPRTIGYGIPSGAALCVSPHGRLSAMGGPVCRFEKRGGRIIRIGDLAPQ
jgi:peptidase E